MKDDRIVYLSMAALVVLAVLSFWLNPAYEKGVWIGLVALGNVLSTALGAKYGLAKPDGTPTPSDKEQP